jgi:hypothetical protein
MVSFRLDMPSQKILEWPEGTAVAIARIPPWIGIVAKPVMVAAIPQGSVMTPIMVNLHGAFADLDAFGMICSERERVA